MADKNTSRAELRLNAAISHNARKEIGTLSTRYGKSAGSGLLRSAFCRSCDKHTVHKRGTCIMCNTSIEVGPINSSQDQLIGTVRPAGGGKRLSKRKYAIAMQGLGRARSEAFRAAAEASRAKWEGKETKS